MTIAPEELVSCCATAYSSEAARFLLGESLHPGGTALTDELARALAVGPSQVIADVASGRGVSAVRVARATGCGVIGVDVAAGSLDAATALAREAGLADRVRFLYADARALPFADSGLDGALCECAFCLFPDKAAAAREIARVLRPGARLALADVTADPARLAPELRGLDAYVACLAGARPLQETAALLSRAGLRIDRAESRDEVLAELLERVGARLRVVRLVGGSTLGDLVERAEALLAAANDAVRRGTVGYGVIVATREGA